MQDFLVDEATLFLGSRLKRLGERLQADVARVIEAAGLPVQPAHYPLLGMLDRRSPMSVGDLAAAIGSSQPAVTRGLARLVELGLVDLGRSASDARQRAVALTDAGRELVARSKREVWPQVEAAVAQLTETAPLLASVAAIEAGLAEAPLHTRAERLGLCIRNWEPELAQDFHDINAEWISGMFTLEPTDREVLENPEARIIAAGGDILFVEADGIGIVGACALQRTGEHSVELTKMGVRESVRGRKAGEFLLRAAVRRAREMRAEPLYLLTSSRCAAAIHLYEKLGFTHDADIMRDSGARYARCDVAMRYTGPAAPLRNSAIDDNHLQRA